LFSPTFAILWRRKFSLVFFGLDPRETLNYSIPDTIIDDIRARSDLVEIVSETVGLKKAGNSYKGLCPFHPEKTPSFSVSTDKQVYHCFGCGASGNVFRFIRETQGLSFFEAVKHLAEKAGISLPEPGNNGFENTDHSERERIRSINLQACQVFREQLKNPQQGQTARDYLQSRGFDQEALDSYEIGYAIPSWSALMTRLEKTTKTTPAQLDQAGLVKKKEDKDEYYDRFRNRIIFPLKDPQGIIIGFAGRAIKDEDIPKYLNSPETILYKKSRYLFGLDRARSSIRKEDSTLLVEGYFDQMRATVNGITNSVAPCGTALTSQQILLLKNLSENVTLIFDSDPAGLSAALKGFELLIDHGMNVKILILPDGQDPDSYILKNGREDFLQKVTEARPFLEFHILDVISKGDARTPSGRTDIANQVLPLLAKLRNSVERAEWIKFLAERARLDETALLSEMKRNVHLQRPKMEAYKENAPSKMNPETYLIHLMLSGVQSAIEEIKSRVTLDEFLDVEMHAIAELLYKMADDGRTIRIDSILDMTDDPKVTSKITQMGLAPIQFDNIEQALIDCIGAVKRASAEGKIKNLKSLRNQAIEAGEIQQSREFQIKLKELETALRAS